jgi:NAD(P)-dependent dehydrogenase (short-subunit alcohol dehydrogenase family)
MNLGLAGRVALVTGGARDVGREISLTLAREGAAVAVNYMHSKPDADSVVAEITRAGGRAVAYQADVADYAAVGRMIDRVVADLGRLDIVVNNAGYVEAKLFLETKPEEWKRQVDVDLYGVFNVCHTRRRRSWRPRTAAASSASSAIRRASASSGSACRPARAARCSHSRARSRRSSAARTSP